MVGEVLGETPQAHGVAPTLTSLREQEKRWGRGPRWNRSGGSGTLGHPKSSFGWFLHTENTRV